jgi:hypothetical protein
MSLGPAPCAQVDFEVRRETGNFDLLTRRDGAQRPFDEQVASFREAEAA